MMLAALAGLALLALAPAASAHGWYPYDCCSDRDCWPMGEDADAREPDPQMVPGGYRTADGVFVAEAQTRASRDGRFHICRSGGLAKGSLIAPAQKPACLFVPRPTF
jgi:hypothetical protein